MGPFGNTGFVFILKPLNVGLTVNYSPANMFEFFLPVLDLSAESTFALFSSYASSFLTIFVKSNDFIGVNCVSEFPATSAKDDLRVNFPLGASILSSSLVSSFPASSLPAKRLFALMIFLSSPLTLIYDLFSSLMFSFSAIDFVLFWFSTLEFLPDFPPSP